jgi:hypothetical protein
MRYAIALVILAISALSTGCSTLVAPSYSADYSAIDALKRSGSGKSSVGKVQPEDVSAKVNKITLRGASLAAGDTTFAGYVGKAMMSDLKDAGLYDPNATRRIDMTLLQNDIDVSGMSEGVGLIEVQMTISNAGRTLLNKNYSARTKFESSFAGMVAIPKGQTEYPNLVRELLSTIYRDQAFLQAMRAQ